MSHWFKVKTEFTSINAITKAATELGFPLRHNAICRGYNRMKQTCDLVMSLDGEYDLGFIKEGNSYQVSADFFSSYISDYLADPVVMERANKIADELRKEGKL